MMLAIAAAILVGVFVFAVVYEVLDHWIPE